MAKNELHDLTFEGARILFRNFAGKEGQYNREGDRNFALIIDNEIAPSMAEIGWNIKYLRPREEEDQPQAYLPVAVEFRKGRPPRVVMITSKGRTQLPEDYVAYLDWVEIANVDLIINPSVWNVNGKTGVKAYLKSIYLTVLEDELEKKYSDVPESNMALTVGAGTQLELEAGQDPNVIEGEVIEDDEE